MDREERIVEVVVAGIALTLASLSNGHFIGINV